MRILIIYYRDGSRQVVKPRQEAEKAGGISVKGEKPKMSMNFCGDWHGLANAISGGNYLRYEVL